MNRRPGQTKRLPREAITLAEGLFTDPSEREAFLKALKKGVGKEPAVVIFREGPEINELPRARGERWQPVFVERLQASFRAQACSAYRLGMVYPLDYSSVFMASPLAAIQHPPRRVLDLCASPGGKSMIVSAQFRPAELYCNEPMHHRVGVLIDNLELLNIKNVAVSSADPSVWKRHAPGAMDLVIVDAPCSGQSLLAKAQLPPRAFESGFIDECVGRQRRILGTAADVTSPGGHILYMTCTFTRKENERVIAWFLEGHPGWKAVPYAPLEAYRSPHLEAPSYRLYPHQGAGAGAFTCLLQAPGVRQPLPEIVEPPISWAPGQPRPRYATHDPQ